MRVARPSPPGDVEPFLLFQRQLDQTCTNPIPCANDGLASCPAGCPSNLCIQFQRTCNKCAYAECRWPKSSGSSISAGAIVGIVIGAVVVCGLAIWWCMRRKKKNDLARVEEIASRARKGESSAFQLSQPTSPISSSHRHRSGVMDPRSPTSSQGTGTSSQQLARLPNATAEGQYRDAEGNIIRVYTGKRGAINADPNHPDNGGAGDPFGDQNSLQTDRADSGHSTNVVPIHYVPGGTAAEAIALRNGQNASPGQQAAAARTLDQARQNLWKPRQPPQRPARAPDLDLRLNSQNGGAGGGLPQLPSIPGLAGGRLMQEVPVNDSRDSFISTLSATPSYLSGATGDLHIDVPKIMTRQQVHVGRLQAAEVVQFGTRNMVPEEGGSGPDGTSGGGDPNLPDPFTERPAEHLEAAGGGGQNAQAGSSHPAPHSGGAAGASVTSLGSRRFDDEGNVTNPSPTDLRFSMGSLAYDRTSVSTVGTTSHSVHRGQFLAPPDQPPVPAVPAAYTQRPGYESVASYKSTGNDSILGSFPMIPPAAGSTTSLTAQQPGAALPPVSYKGAGAGAGAGAGPSSPAGSPSPTASGSGARARSSSGRPLTAHSAHSVADSFLGRFPFVPPNVDADGGSLNSQQPGASSSRLTLGSVSEGLGLNDFHFEFEHPPEPNPPLPAEYQDEQDARDRLDRDRGGK